MCCKLEILTEVRPQFGLGFGKPVLCFLFLTHAWRLAYCIIATWWRGFFSAVKEPIFFFSTRSGKYQMCAWVMRRLPFPSAWHLMCVRKMLSVRFATITLGRDNIDYWDELWLLVFDVSRCSRLLWKPTLIVGERMYCREVSLRHFECFSIHTFFFISKALFIFLLFSWHDNFKQILTFDSFYFVQF